MYIHPNSKLRALYTAMMVPLVSAAMAVYLGYRALLPQHHGQMGRDLLLAALIFGISALSWNFGLGFVRAFRKFLETCQSVACGELALRTETTGLTEILELATAFSQTNESLDTSLSHWILASQENHRIFLSLVQTIVGAVDTRDFYMRGHAGRVTYYSTWIAKEMGLTQPQVERIRISALLHDIGKIGIDDRILAKPGSLTKEEFEIMKEHPLRGAAMLRPIPELGDIIAGVELHHESLDGRGYPYGLQGNEIPLMARIITVADTFDAMTAQRSYQDAMEVGYVMRVLRKLSGAKFDSKVVEALCRVHSAGHIQLPPAIQPEEAYPRDILISA